MAPLLKPDWSIRNFPIGKFCIGKFPIGESGATSKTGLALGFCGDSFSASPWGGEFAVGLGLQHRVRVVKSGGQKDVEKWWPKRS